jgi:hypothetical protein
MTVHITKKWIEDGKLITQVFEGKDIYKCEWVGLTDEERNTITRHHAYVDNIIKATEAKLKEKNT